MTPLSEPPIRVCCMQRHHGVVCTDGTVMCCICFGKFAVDDLADYGNGSKTDVCVPCSIADQRR